MRILLMLVMLGALPTLSHAVSWGSVATISGTEIGHLCNVVDVTDSDQHDLDCSENNPYVDTTGGTLRIKAAGESDSNATLSLVARQSGSDNQVDIWSNQTGGLAFRSYSGEGFYFIGSDYTNDRPLRIQGDGKVGIATSTPTEALEVSGTVSATAFVGDGSLLTNISTTALSLGIDDLTDGKVLGASYYFGQFAGDAVTTTTHSYNNAIGFRALQLNTTGVNNNALGYAALQYNKGSYNNAIGTSALNRNTTGNYNIAIGHLAGHYIADGSTANTITNNSLFLGADTKAQADNQTNQIVIGYDAIGAGDNSVVLGNDNIVTTVLKGNVGIGTDTPAFTGGSGLEVEQNGTATVRIQNSAFNASELRQTGSSFDIISLGAQPLTLGTNNIERLHIDATGNVGISTTTPNAKLEVIGTVSATAFVGDGSLLTDISTTALSLGIDDLTDGQHDTTNTNLFLGSAGFSGGFYNNSNIAIGKGALATSNTISTDSWLGDNNIALGLNALNKNTTGFSNTALGLQALYNNQEGYSNTAIGVTSLAQNTTGARNVAVGSGAGNYAADGTTANASPNDSIFIGNSAKALTSNQTNQIVIGYDATGAGDNSVVLGNDNIVTTVLKGNVGVGTGAPSYTLHIHGGQKQFAITDSQNPTSGRWTIGTFASDDNTTLHFLDSLETSRFALQQDGKLGLGGIFNPQEMLEVSGTVSATAFVGDGSLLTGVSTVGGLDDLTDATANYTASYTIAIGEGALNEADLGPYNTAVGYQAGYGGTASTTASTSFSGFGYWAGYNNTGGYVSAIGRQSAYQNTGNYLTAAGVNAAYQNSGKYLTATGYQAAFKNTGNYVTADGVAAAYENTGIYVTADGYQAGYENSGDRVTAAGANAARENSGDRVTAAGYHAAYQNSGTNVTAAGYYAAFQNTGDYLSAYGYEAGHTNTGNNVVAIGYQAGKGNSTANQFIVQQANVNTTPLIQGDFSTGYVGIGTDAPSVTLHINSTTPMIMLTDGDTGADSWISADSSTGSLFISADSYDEIAGSDIVFRTNNQNNMIIEDGGNVGIGTTAPTASLTVVGTISATNFVGDGSGLTGIDASALTLGVNDLTDATANYTASYTIAIGEGALNYAQDGLNSVAVGYQAGYGATAASGTAYTTGRDHFSGFGYRAGYNNAGDHVSAMGYQSARENTGGNVTAMGYASAYQNTGASVSAMGSFSANGNTGASVSAMGVNSALSNTGVNVSAMGVNSARENTGDHVSAMGHSSAYGNTGAGVSAMGHFSAYWNTGDYISAMGLNSAYGNTGDHVSAMGYQSARDNTGSFVTAVGYASARSNTADNVVALGYEAGKENATANQFIVQQANVNATPLIQGDFSTGNVNIAGTVSATAFVGDGSGLTGVSSVDGLDDLTDATANYTTSYTIAIGEGALNYAQDGLNSVAVGYQAGYGATAASGTAYTTDRDHFSGFGYRAGYNNVGNSVTAMGANSANGNTGAGVTAIGVNSAYGNTREYVTAVGVNSANGNTGMNVAAIGNSSAYGNTGSYVSALGQASAYGNTGSYVAAIGNSSAYGNTGMNVSTMGYQSAYQNTGDNVSAMGYQSAYQNTGAGVVAMGYSSAYGNTGDNVSAMGLNSAYGNTGDHVSALGQASARDNTGSFVTAVGYASARSNTANNVVALGYQAGKENATANQFIVQQANVNTTPLIQGDFSTGNVGIGTTNTTTRLTVLADNGLGETADDETVIATFTDTFVDGANNNNFEIGTRRLTTADHNNWAQSALRLEGNIDKNDSAQSWIEFRHNGVATNNAIAFGEGVNGSGEWMVIDDGSVGIGTTSPTEALEVIGTISATAFVGDGSALTGIDASALTLGVNYLTDAKANYTTSYTIAIGEGALNYAQDGLNSVAVGYQAGYGATAASGTAYTAGRDHFSGFGYQAGYNNTGDNVSAMGYSSAYQNTGNYVSAMGYGSAYQNTGNYVSAMGMNSASGNTGANVSAMGHVSAYQNTGGGVSAMGHASAYQNTGLNVSAMGYGSAYKNTGVGASSLGYYSAHSNTGDFVTAVGYGTAQSNTANNVVALGYQAGQGNSTPNQFIVQQANVNATPLIQGNFSTGNVGIGTTAPSDTLHLVGGGLRVENDEGINFGGTWTRITGHNSGQRLMFFTDDVERMRVNSGGNVGIGTAAPTEALEVIGTISATAFVGDGSALTGIDASALTLGVNYLTDAKANYTTSYTIAIGEGALNYAQDGLNSVAVGYQAGYGATAASGTAYTTGRDHFSGFGYQAGYNNAGDNVSTMGAYSAHQNTGDNISTMGANSAFENTGDNVTAVGGNSAYQNTGFYLAAMGNASAYQNTGSNVSAMGMSSARENTGDYVSAIGHSSAYQNTGNNVSAVGYYSARENTGDAVSAMGYASAYQNTGVSVTAMGMSSARDNAGNNVIAMGYEAGRANTADNVVALGYEAGKSNATANQFIVQQANVNATPLIQGDFSTGKVGIGTTEPSATLHVDGDVRVGGTGSEACADANDYGKIRMNPTTNKLQICKPPA